MRLNQARDKYTPDDWAKILNDIDKCGGVKGAEKQIQRLGWGSKAANNGAKFELDELAKAVDKGGFAELIYRKRIKPYGDNRKFFECDIFERTGKKVDITECKAFSKGPGPVQRYKFKIWLNKFPDSAEVIAKDLDDLGTTISDITLKVVVKDEVFLNPGIKKILDDFAKSPNGRKIDMFTSTGKQIY